MHPYSYWGHFWIWCLLDDSSKGSLMILKSGYDINEKVFAWQYWNVFLSPLPIKTKAQALFGSIQVLYHCFGLYPPRPLLMHTHCTFPLWLIAWKVRCIIRCFGLYAVSYCFNPIVKLPLNGLERLVCRSK